MKKIFCLVFLILSTSQAGRPVFHSINRGEMIGKSDFIFSGCYTFPGPKSMNSVREKIRTEIGRDYDKSLKSKIEYLNPILRGWSNYFCWMNSGEHFHKIGRYSIQRLNGWNRRKQKRVRRSYRRLSGKDLEEIGLFAMHGRIRPTNL